MLCRKLVDLLTLVANSQNQGARRVGMTQELVTLITGFAHYLKIVIRTTLVGGLKLGSEHGVAEALGLFLHKLQLFSVHGKNPSAGRLVGVKHDVALAQLPASANPNTYNVMYGFRSLAPEIAGNSPFREDSQDTVPSNVQVPSPPSDLCVACGKTIEEGCVRLGTYTRWHSSCLQCKVCGIGAASPATGNADEKALVGSGKGADDGNAVLEINIARRLPVNAGSFVWSPDCVTNTQSFGEDRKS